MKIGIIGINRYAKYLNFACNAHVFAFQKFLSENGHDSTILDYQPAYFNNFNLRHPADYAEQKHREALLRKPKTRQEAAARQKAIAKWSELEESYRSVYAEREQRYDKFEKFIAKNLVFTKNVYDSDLLEIEDPGFDAYICVTDVIWQAFPRIGFDRGFLLGSKALEGKPKIAYAASRGASPDFDKKHKKQFFGYLQDIDSISVREQDFSEYIERESDLSAPLVLDPVMLHDKKFWQEVSVKPPEERYLVLYYVMESATDTVDKAVEYAKLHDLTIVELSDHPSREGKVIDPDVKHITRYSVGIEEWLGYIEHADAIFTNSFHGCCFAVLYEKTFFVGSRNGQKVPNFLATFDLSSRQFSPNDDVNKLSEAIDYVAVNKILDEKRKHSSTFILDAIGNAKQRVASTPVIDHSRYDKARRRLKYPVRFHSGPYENSLISLPHRASKSGLVTDRLASGALAYTRKGARYLNDGSSAVESNRFRSSRYAFDGWTMRFRVDNRWFWYLDDGSIVVGDAEGSGLEARKAVLADSAQIPHLPVNRIAVVIMTARWSKLDSERGTKQDLVRRAWSFGRRAVAKARRSLTKAR
ncbi:polysaccharide pyruvyl transferase family protein [Salinibacterium sp. SWN139]|uniref:polysaccharide pyruvyl transferase family protein n=1 Tax=Salinibacterium sp. SWN139 TaxID=2792055 RepID=UPI0018CEE9AC|nr:polysaccharide pyruvyl transferase family protein [Salinibacterium sp. SWN139]MBH0053562.1 polysaccharide pyruvyl transferase family protein [Salinibacterium sp. SWN139]